MKAMSRRPLIGEVPSESTFSRAFGQFSSDNRPQVPHPVFDKKQYATVRVMGRPRAMGKG